MARPRKRKHLASFRLPAWLLDRLRTLDNGHSQAVNIEQALIEKHGWQPPAQEE